MRNHTVIRKILLLLSLFFFTGCSLESLTAWRELDKVQVVKNSTYYKHYRAYFQRTDLLPIRHGKKYLFFYNRHTKDLAILLHPKHKYLLYSFSHPGTVIRLSASRRHSYTHVLRALKKKGYRQTSPLSIGFITQVSLRKYKKIKTLRVDVKDYRRLLNLYKKAIRTYDASKIKRIKTRLPKILISRYYKKYKAQASTWEQFRALEIIAEKLRLDQPVQTKPLSSSPAQDTELLHQEEDVKEKQEEDTEAVYHHYLNEANYEELTQYLASSKAKKTLSYAQYSALQKRYNVLKEKRLLEKGSLEELITAYKKNKNPKYKAKIMQRIKQLQKQ
jgi:hypothetical protein